MTRHPRALYFLGLVQLWERFACFATLPLLVLYLSQRHGLRPEAAVLLLGLHQALCYLAGLGGGHLADRFLGGGDPDPRQVSTYLAMSVRT